MHIDTAHQLPTREYYREKYPKTNVVLHHTVSSTAASALAWWRQDPVKVGTAYVIDKDGTIYQAFPEEYWAHHLGLTTRNNYQRNRQSIGIELVNEGFGFVNLKKDRELHWLYDGGPIYKGPTVRQKWRGGEFWPTYADAQIDACCALVVAIMRRHNMKGNIAPFGILDPTIPDRYTIYTHHNVRADKTDVSPAFPLVKFTDYIKENYQQSV